MPTTLIDCVWENPDHSLVSYRRGEYVSIPAETVLGEGVVLHYFSLLIPHPSAPISLGARVVVGRSSRIVTASPVGDDVRIGENCVIFGRLEAGAKIGNHVIVYGDVAAGVRVPDYAVVPRGVMLTEQNMDVLESVVCSPGEALQHFLNGQMHVPRVAADTF